MEAVSFLWIVVGAVVLDWWLGDPVGRWHPVAWLGRSMAAAIRLAPRGQRSRFWYGLALIIIGLVVVAGLMALIEGWLPGNRPLGWLVHIVLLKLSFSLKGLRSAGQRIARALGDDRLDQARRWLGWDLVSRPTDALSESQVVAAAIESLAENLTDSLLAPLLAYALAGLPGAWAYRFVNTADAMLGYRSAEFEYLGKAAARLDDFLNWLPARLAAVLMSAAAPLCGASLTGAWRAVRTDRNATASPNAGWTMAAAAGALGVRLEKVGYYTLNAAGRPPGPIDLSLAGRLLLAAAALCLLLVLVVGGMIRAL